VKLIDGDAIWRLHAQDGFPVELALPFLADNGEVPTWEPLLLAAKADGANIPRLVARLKGAVADAYRPDAAAYICAGLDALLPRLEAA